MLFIRTLPGKFPYDSDETVIQTGNFGGGDPHMKQTGDSGGYSPLKKTGTLVGNFERDQSGRGLSFLNPLNDIKNTTNLIYFSLFLWVQNETTRF